jgi:hypothetical protein
MADSSGQPLKRNASGAASRRVKPKAGRQVVRALSGEELVVYETLGTKAGKIRRDVSDAVDKPEHRIDLLVVALRLEDHEEVFELEVTAVLCGFVVPGAVDDADFLRQMEAEDWGNRASVLAVLYERGAHLFVHASDELKADHCLVRHAVHAACAQHTLNRPYLVELVLEAAKLDVAGLRHFMLEGIRAKKHCVSGNCVARHFGVDRELFEEMVRCVPGCIRQVPAALRDDFEFMKKAVERKRGASDVFAAASPRLRGDRDFVKIAAETASGILLNASRELRSDKALVLELVTRRGEELAGVADELRKDRDVVEAALRQDGTAWNFASLELFGDVGLFRLACRSHACILHTAAAAIKADKQLVLEAVRACGMNLEWAGPFRDDMQVVKAALTSCRCKRVVRFARVMDHAVAEAASAHNPDVKLPRWYRPKPGVV